MVCFDKFMAFSCSKEFLPLAEAKKAKNRKKQQKQQKSGDATRLGSANNMKNKMVESRYSFNKPMLPPVSQFLLHVSLANRAIYFEHKSFINFDKSAYNLIYCLVR